MDDLLYFLRNGKNKIIVLTMVLLNTEEDLKKDIRRFIKRKSEKYPNIIFLYYAVRDDDFGRISIISKNKKEYPKMCHIYNVTDLLVEVSGIDNVEILKSSFKKLNNYYKNFKEDAKISEKSDEIKQPVITDKEHNENNFQQENIFNQVQDVQDKQPEINPVNLIVEQKKFNQKLELLKKVADDYNIDFFRECQKRKKEEEKIKKEKK